MIRKLLGAGGHVPHEPPDLDKWLTETLGIDPTHCPCCGIGYAKRASQDLRAVAANVSYRWHLYRRSRTTMKLAEISPLEIKARPMTPVEGTR